MMKKKILMCLVLCVIMLFFMACGETQESAPVYEQAENGASTEENDPAVEQPVQSELSDDLGSLTFELDGVVYTLPIPFAELEANGWKGTWFDLRIDPGTNRGATLENGNQSINVSFYNFSDDVQLPNESYIDRISALSFLDDTVQLIFPRNIMLGASYEEVIAAYGYPAIGGVSYEYGFRYLVYFVGSAGIRIIIDLGTELVEDMHMYYLGRIPAVEDPPAAVITYEAPTELGDDWRAFTISIDGDTYRLPTPMTAFEENGWDVRGFEQPRLPLPPGGDERVGLRKDDQVIITFLHNYDDVIRVQEHTFVTMIDIDFDFFYIEPAPSIELPGGITENSTSEEIISAFGMPDEIRELDGHRHYTFGDRDNGIQILVNMETERIELIRISHRPASLS